MLAADSPSSSSSALPLASSSSDSDAPAAASAAAVELATEHGAHIPVAGEEGRDVQSDPAASTTASSQGLYSDPAHSTSTTTTASSAEAEAAAAAAAGATPAKGPSTLRRMGVTNGLLGVSQERVEMVMKQALPVMGGMASQNVLNLADSVMVGEAYHTSPLFSSLRYPFCGVL